MDRKTARKNFAASSNKSSNFTRWIPRQLELLEDRLTPTVTLTNAPTWIDAGPNNISGGEVSVITNTPQNSSVIGAIQAVAADPTDANILYAGGVNGGVWKTLNGGATWTPLTDSFPSLSISTISINPDNHLQILAGIGGTADGTYAIDPNTGAHTVLDSRGIASGDLIGALYSGDGGSTWKVLSNNIAGQNVVGVAVRNTYMLVAGDNGVFRSTDGGSTFSRVISSGTFGLPAQGVFDLAADPGAPVNQIVSATWDAGVVTVKTAAPHALTNLPNLKVVVTGLSPNGYNGTFVYTIVDPTTFTYSLATNPGNLGAGGTQGGLSNAITTATWAAGGGGVATITTAVPSGLAIGESVTVVGVDKAGYNGTFVVTSVNIAQNKFTYALAVNPGVGAGGLETIATNAITAATWLGGIATITTSTAHTVAIGETIVVAGVSLPGYNGTYTVTGVNLLTNQVTYALSVNPGNTISGGTETNDVDPILAASWFNGLATITTTAAHNVAAGQTVTIAGVSNAGYNGVFVVNSVISATQFTYSLAANPGGNGTGGTETTAPNAITSASWSTGTATITTVAANGVVVGETVTIAGIKPAGFNGSFIVTGVLSATQFTYALAVDPGTMTTGGTETADPNADPGARNRFYVALRTSTGPIDPITGTPGGLGVYRTDDGGLNWGDVTDRSAVGMQIGAKTTNVQIAVFNSGIITNNIVYVAVENNNPTGSKQQSSQSDLTGYDYAWANRKSEVSTIMWSPNQGGVWTRMDVPRTVTTAQNAVEPDPLAPIGAIRSNGTTVTVTTGRDDGAGVRHGLRDGDEVVISGVRDNGFYDSSTTPPTITPSKVIGKDANGNNQVNGTWFVHVLDEYTFELTLSADPNPNGNYSAFYDPASTAGPNYGYLLTSSPQTGGTPVSPNGTWAQVIGANPGERSEFFDLAVDPTSSSTVYLGTDHAIPNFNANSAVYPETYTSMFWRGNRLANPTSGNNSATRSNQWTAISNNGTTDGSAPAADVRDIVVIPGGRMFAATGGGLYALSNANGVPTSIDDATWAAGVATISTTIDTGYTVGQSVIVSGVASAVPIVGGAANGYNGTFVITAVTPVIPATPTTPAILATFSYALASDPGVYIETDSVFSNIATAAFAYPDGFTAEQSVKIVGVSNNTYNGTYVVSSAPGGSEISAADTISAATWAAGVATITTTAVNGVYVGETVFLSGVDIAGYNGKFVVTGTPSSTQFTFALVANPGGSGTVGTETPVFSNAIVNAKWFGNVVTITTAGTNGFAVGQSVTISQVVASGANAYNGTFTITSVNPGANQFTYAKNGNPGTFSNGSGGVASLSTHTITAASWAAGVVTMSTSVANGLRVGDSVTISGVNPVGYNGTYVVLSTPSATQFTYARPYLVTPGAYVSGGIQNLATNSIVDISWGGAGGGTVTVTMAGDPHVSVGESVIIDGILPVAYNGTVVVTSVNVGLKQFTFALAVDPGVATLTLAQSLTYTRNSNLQPAITDDHAQVFPGSVVWTSLNGGLGVTDITQVAYDTLNNVIFAGTIDTQAITENTSTATFAVTGATWAANVATVTTTLAHTLSVGQTVTVAGSNIAVYNGVYTITAVTATTFQYTLFLGANPGAGTGGTAKVVLPYASYSLSGASWAANVATITTTAAHNIVVGQTVTITGFTVPAYNGNFVVTAVTATTFKYALPLASNPGPSTPTAATPATAFVGLNYSSFFDANSLQDDFYDQANVFTVLVDNSGLDNSGATVAQTSRFFLGSNFREVFRQTVDSTGAQTALTQLTFAAPLTQTIDYSGLVNDDAAALTNANQNVHIVMALNQNDPRRAIFGYNGLYEDADPSGTTPTGAIVNNLLPNFNGVMTGHVETLIYGGKRNGININQVVFMTTSTNELWVRGEFGPTFSKLTTGFAGQIFAVVADPDDYRHVFIAQGNRVLESKDYTTGVFTDISANLIGPPTADGTAGSGILTTQIRSLALYDSNPGAVTAGDLTLLAGGRGGVFRLTANPECPLAPWTKYGQALPGTVVNDLKLYGNRLIAGTAGRGIWQIADVSPTITQNPVLTIDGTAAADTITISLDPNNSNVILVYDGTATTAYTRGTFSSIVVNAGTGADTVYIGSKVDSTTHLPLAGSTTSFVNFKITVNGGGDAGDKLIIDDKGSTLAVQATVTSTTIGAGVGDTLFVGCGKVVYAGFDNLTPGNLGTVDLSTGSGDDNFILTSLSPAQTILRGGNGSENYSITLDPASTAVLTVTDLGVTGTDTLTVNGTLVDDIFAISSAQISLGTNVVNYSGIENLAVLGGGGKDTFNVASVGGIVANSFDGQDGSDIYNVAMDPASIFPISIGDTGVTPANVDTLNIIGTAGNDTFTALGFTMQLGTQVLSYSGIEALNLNGSTGTDTLLVLGTAGNDTFTSTPTHITGGGLPIGYTNFEFLTVQGLAGNDTFNITGAAASIANVFDGQANADVYNVTLNPASTTVITIADSALASSGTDALNVNGTAGSDTFGIKPSDIILGTNIVGYDANIETLTVNGLAGNNTFNINGVGSNTNTFNGGVGNDTFNFASGLGAAGKTVVFNGGAGTDSLAVTGTAGDDNAGVDITSATGTGAFLGLRQTVTFTGLEGVGFDGAGGTNNFTWRDRTNTVYGTPLTPETGVIFAPTSATAGIVLVGTGTYPSVSVSNITGALALNGDGNNNGSSDIITVLGFSTNGQTSAFNEPTSTNGSDTITVSDRSVTIVNATAGPLLNANFTAYANGTPTFRMIEVRGGNESVIGDRFFVTPSLLANIFIDGMNPTSGVQGDQLTVISNGPTTRTSVNNPALGPPQTRVTQPDGASLGYRNIEKILINDTSPGGGGSTGGGGGSGGGAGSTNGYYVAATDAGVLAEVRVFDRLNGSLKFAFNPFPGYMGAVTVAVGDVNGDGIPDVVVGAGPGGPPAVKIFSGIDMSLLASFYAYDVGFTGGLSVAVGDLNADGYADVITGSGYGAGPHIKVFDGLTFAQTASYYAFDPGFINGINVAVGDTNNDGTPDLIVGARAGAESRVTVFDGKNSSVLQNFFAFDPAFTGGVYVAAGDVNGDGFADIILGAGAGSTPDVRVVSGRDGSDLARFPASQGTVIGTVPFENGVRVAAVDFDDDGIAEILTGKGPGTAPILRFYKVSQGTGVLAGSLQAFGGSYAGGVFVGG